MTEQAMRSSSMKFMKNKRKKKESFCEASTQYEYEVFDE